MNFGYLTNYISSSIAGGGGPEAAPFEPPGEISDWGIDETPVHSSRSTSISYKHPGHTGYPSTPNAYGNFNPTYNSHLHNGSTINDSSSNLCHTVTNEEISLYIRKYLSLNGCVKEFWEKFKYDLIVSNLLDESMILSKNEQAIKDMTNREGDLMLHRSHQYAKILNDDGMRLRIFQKNYNLKLPPASTTSSVLQCIHLLIHLLKSQLNGHANFQGTLKMFKILLIVSTKILQRRRILTFFTVSKIATQLQRLLLDNYKVNKSFMVTLLRIKEEQIFNFMNKSSANGESGCPSNENSFLLDHALSILTIHFVKSIKSLLPYMNGPAFEKYCLVNNVNWNLVVESEYKKEEVDEGLNLSVQLLTRKLARFNQVRKVFLCQLLTSDEQPEKNFFLCKLWDDFGVKGANFDLKLNETLSEFSKLSLIHSVMEEQSKFTQSIEAIFEKTKLEVQEDQDILAGAASTNNNQLAPSLLDNEYSNESDVNSKSITQLIDKLQTITTNLKFFEKYNQSTSNVTDIDELNEKVFIFSQLGQDLDSIKELHQVCLNDISFRVSRRSQNSTPSSSKRNSKEGGTTENGFSLKSFHTSSSIKKRYSLPVKAVGSTGSISTPKSSPILSNGSVSSEGHRSKEGEDKKYKRLSAGLPVGLLTVFEEPNDTGKKIKNSVTSSAQNRAIISPRSMHGPGDARSISLDDNYINILPPTSYYSETYNHTALEALSRKQQPSINTRIASGSRYSLNSMNSNVSGISDMLVSTNQTSEQEELNSPSFSQEELKMKLEESFNRIYSLENENSKLKQQLPQNESVDCTVGENIPVDNAFKSGLLAQLETKLQQRSNSTVDAQEIDEEN